MTTRISGQRALLEQVVVQSDPGRAEKAGDIRADPIGLSGSVDLENLRAPEFGWPAPWPGSAR